MRSGAPGTAARDRPAGPARARFPRERRCPLRARRFEQGMCAAVRLHGLVPAQVREALPQRGVQGQADLLVIHLGERQERGNQSSLCREGRQVVHHRREVLGVVAVRAVGPFSAEPFNDRRLSLILVGHRGMEEIVHSAVKELLHVAMCKDHGGAKSEFTAAVPSSIARLRSLPIPSQ